MTITLTKEELESYSLRLQEWYQGKLVYLANNAIQYIALNRFRDNEMEKRLKVWHEEYEKTHPMPDWRTLL